MIRILIEKQDGEKGYDTEISARGEKGADIVGTLICGMANILRDLFGDDLEKAEGREALVEAFRMAMEGEPKKLGEQKPEAGETLSEKEREFLRALMGGKRP